MKNSKAVWVVLGLAAAIGATGVSARETAAERFAQKKASAKAKKVTVTVAKRQAANVAAALVPVVAYDDESAGTRLVARKQEPAERAEPLQAATIVRTGSGPVSTNTDPGDTGGLHTGNFDKWHPPGPGDRPSVWSGWVWNGNGWAWGGCVPCHGGGGGGASRC